MSNTSSLRNTPAHFPRSFVKVALQHYVQRVSMIYGCSKNSNFTQDCKNTSLDWTTSIPVIPPHLGEYRGGPTPPLDAYGRRMRVSDVLGWLGHESEEWEWVSVISVKAVGVSPVSPAMAGPVFSSGRCGTLLCYTILCMYRISACVHPRTLQWEVWWL